MGFDPRTVDRMTLWEFVACLDGFRNATPKAQPMSDELLSKYCIKGFC